MSKPFIHLHVHTEMSLLDGAARMLKHKKSPLMKACKQKNMPAIAITDHGAMYGVYTFQKLAVEEGIKPIIGCELYICDDMRDKTSKQYDHILLLAKNETGYRNLVKLDSLAFTEGFYYKPRIDLKFLRERCEGLICTSACIGGTIPQFLLSNDYDGAKAYAIMLRDMFAPGDFYIEIQDHGIPEEQRCNPLLVKLAREIGVKVVATNDVHYIEKTDAEAHDVLLCIQTGRTIDDPKRMRFTGDNFYLKTYEEMEELFGWCPEALMTPFEIADKCNVKIEKKELLPPYTPADGSLPADFLRRIAYEGLSKRYGELSQEVKDRAEYELATIIDLGFAEYYLIVWDFIDYAKRSSIPVGAGRGSGVGSIIAYAVGITNVDPLKYNLLFERFLNRERVSMPDFDIDFCVEGRGKVIEYVIEKYGAEKVCQILALGTMAAKNAIKDVARVYSVPLSDVNSLTKLMPNGKGHIDDFLGIGKPELAIPEVIAAYREDAQMHKIIDLAMQLEGMPRNCSKHAAGVVICKEVISDFVPLSKSGDDVTTQFQKDEVEEVGMLKMDFLGLRTLTDIDKAKHYIEETTGDIVDFEVLGYEDKRVFDLLSSGETDAVFQLESPGMKKFMKELQPISLEDIIAGVSLYRPGPMDSIPKYVDSKNNPANISYDDPLLEPILNMTYGCIVYQEQVMQIVQSLSGYSLGRADILRRAMGKKKADVMAMEKSIFINGAAAEPEKYNDDGSVKSKAEPAVDGAVKRGVPEEVAGVIFDQMAAFASYAFNKSHAAAYAVVAYETAYLKAYYPVQFICAVINNRITNSDEVAKYVEYLRQSGVEVYPPDVNISDVYFRCEGKGLRFGLMGIKNVGESAITLAVAERNSNGSYKNLSDFIRRTEDSNVNKRLLESLMRAGAMDCFKHTRATLISNYEQIMLLNNYEKKKRLTGQFSMFGLLQEDDGEQLIEVKEYDRNDLLVAEKEVLNVYMSGHPLDEYRELYAEMPFNLSLIKQLLSVGGNDGAEDGIDDSNDEQELVRLYDKKAIELGGMLSDLRIRVTKSTNKSMGVAKIEDLHSSIDVVMFPSTFDRLRHLFVKDNIVVVSGELQVGDRPQIVVKDMRLWRLSDDADMPIAKANEGIIDQTPDQEFTKLYINVLGDDEGVVTKVLGILADYKGNIPSFIKFNGKVLNSGFVVSGDKALRWKVAEIVGGDNVKIV